MKVIWTFTILCLCTVGINGFALGQPEKILYPGEKLTKIGEFEGKSYFTGEYGRSSNDVFIFCNENDLEKIYIESLAEFEYLVETINSTASYWISGAVDEVPQADPWGSRICPNLCGDFVCRNSCLVGFNTICQTKYSEWTTIKPDE